MNETAVNSSGIDKTRAPFFMAVAGNIGVGKTTLTRLISDRLCWQAFYEKVINNPYLSDFYADMSRWSFNLQVFFLARRFIDQRVISQSTEPCIQDRSIYEDAEIFAYILHKQGYMSDRDYENYRDLFYAMTEYLRKPDLILYLRASTWTLVTRIRKRGREFEKRITVDYLHELNEAYERWIKSIQGKWNVLVIDADYIDFENEPDQLESIFRQIQRYVKGAGD
jgi:deoxyadenosine/deoxycytidine kinase